MKKVKKNKGITLIALVITIIVLLILAGISITALTGQNGLLTKASQAKEVSVMAEESEIIKMAYSDLLTDNITERKGFSTNDLQERINDFKAGTVEKVDEMPEGGTLIENGVSSGTLCKITMDYVYYMYLNNPQDVSAPTKKFYIELYSDYSYSDLLETLTFDFDDSITFISSWFESKYCIGLEYNSFAESFPGGGVCQNDFHYFKYHNRLYCLEVTVWTLAEGSTGEDVLSEGKVFKAYLVE